MPSSVEIILVPALMIVVGILLKRFGVLVDKDGNTLAKIVLNISLPSLIFTSIAHSTISGEIAYMPIIALGLSGICMVIAYIYSKLRSYDKVKTWTLIILLSLINTGFMGYPIVMGVFGNDGFLYAVFYDFSTSILMVIFGTVLSTLFGGNKKEVLKRALTFVPLWAVVFGVIFNMFHITLPFVIDNSLNYFGASTIPLIMLSVGLKINFENFKSSVSDMLFITLSRLLLAPVILYLILMQLGVTGYLFSVSILQSAMPTAMNSLVLAIIYDLDLNITNSVIVLTAVGSIFTLPLIMTLLL